jgi:hypothetical protein
MANVLYPKWKEAILNGGTNVALNGTVRATLVDLADYTYNAAHDFFDDVPVAARVATVTISAGKTYTNGLFDATDVTFPAVTGDPSEALIIWIDTTVEATSRLVAFFDTGVTGLPVTPNGGDINIVWNGSGIFQL